MTWIKSNHVIVKYHVFLHNDGIRTMLSHPHELMFPAVMISITVLAFNLLGDGLRDAMDTRMRSGT